MNYIYRIFKSLTILLTVFPFADTGWWGSCDRCHWMSWKPWSDCSSSCGGGYQSRSRGICCDTSWTFATCLSKCGKSDSDSYERRQCNKICYHGYYSSYSCICYDGYYDTCCSSRCRQIANCAAVKCFSSYDSRCKKCNDQGTDRNHSLYWPEPDNTICSETCSWKRNWCWPGKCNDTMASSCTCSSNFRLRRGSNKLCDLDKKPDLVTCRIGTESASGTASNSTSGPGGCQTENSTFIKFQPAKLSYTFEFEFSVDVPMPYPHHINTSIFGITGAEITVVKTFVNQLKQNLASYPLSDTNGCDRLFNENFPVPGAPVTCSRNIDVHDLSRLQDGERLCIQFVAKAGGYLKTKDFRNEISSNHYYIPTQSTNEVCFKYDNSPPIHCMDHKSRSPCSFDPIQVEQKVTRDGTIQVSFKGWDDPYPAGGFSDQASGIKQYTMAIHELKENGTSLSMKEASLSGLSYHKSNSLSNITISFPRQPALFAITLEVLDVAKNPKKARIFVLFDNSSTIMKNHDKRLRVYSASKQTNYTWQTHLGNVCISWHGRYYNSYYKHTNLLKPIVPDFHRFYQGVYEQLTGVLPVSGTPNIDGIIEFRYDWKLYNGTVSTEHVPNFPTESFCKNFGIQDGHELTFFLKSVDIVGNNLSEPITVKVDSTVPDIENIWLVKDNHKQLFVHNSTDLYKMNITFDIYDIHSGILTIEWRLGTSNGANDLGNEFIKPNRIKEKICPSNSSCYCPKIGKCEMFRYVKSFLKLISSKAQHNREYYITIIATNHAKLVNVERIDILVDDSAPEEGVVIEGTLGSPDVDYINAPEVTISWHGFIDHESGISIYRVGIYERCLTFSELDFTEESNFTHIFQNTDNSMKVYTIDAGRYFTSVVAYNGAMEPSKVVCSDGFTRDSTPPNIHDLVLENAKTSDFIACYNSTPWLIMTNLTRVQLINTNTCRTYCSKALNDFNISALPVGQAPSEDEAIADDLCQRKEYLRKTPFIYIPSSKIALTWNITDKESEIRDILVGYASDKTQINTPNLKPYHATITRHRYTQVHSGIDSGIPFYIMLKAINKAGLETVFPLGPIIIDETPPIQKDKISVIIHNKKIFAAWQNNAFTDLEQQENISTVLFRIGSDTGYTTPFLQTPIKTNCPGSTDLCIDYPLIHIQQKNNEAGLNFFFELHVYNIAGLYITTKTEMFQVPSLFPPGHGVVFDKDPDDMGIEGDIDFQLNLNSACVEWNGFWHHQNVTIEVGIGKFPAVDDVMSFSLHYTGNNHNHACFSNVNLSTNQKYHFVVRANCSGGSTTSFSDGFVIIDATSFHENTTVGFGQDFANNSIMKQHVNLNITANTTTVWKIPSLLDIGKEYVFHIKDNVGSLDILSDDLVWVRSENKPSSQSKIFIPLTANPKLNFFTSSGNALIEEIIISQIYKNVVYHTAKDSISVSWSLQTQFNNYLTGFQVALLMSNCPNGNLTKHCILIEKPYQNVGKINAMAISDYSFLEGKVYYTALKVCFQHICLPPKLSNAIIFDSKAPISKSISAYLSQTDSKTHKIEIEFDSFRCDFVTMHHAIGYTWTIKSNIVSRVLDRKAFAPQPNGTVIEINDDIILPVYTHSNLSLCVTGYCSSGSTVEICSLLNRKTHPNEFDKDVLYEINADSADLTEIKQLVNSANIGHKLNLIHDNEMDFCRPNTKVVGATLNPSRRHMDWYLISGSRNIPKNCENDINCLQHRSTTAGVVTFKRTYLSENNIYYVCAHANSSTIRRELFEEHLDELRICGNGFVVDNTSPRGGFVTLHSTSKHFLTSSREMTVSWDGFTDGDNIITRIYSLQLKAFEIAIGTVPEGEDVLRFTDVGHASSFTAHNLSLSNGQTYFATVKAIDFVNLEHRAVSIGITVDTTKPAEGNVHIEIITSALNTNSLRILWDGFKDTESGIASFQMGIGSHKDTTDIIELTTVDGNFVDITDLSNFQDGHEYFATIVVYNNAGLLTRIVSQPVKLDLTPPKEGVVNDGMGAEKGDVDYQSDIRTLSAFWTGFDDPHSGIASYSVGVGTLPGQFDVEPLTENALKTAHSWKGLYAAGTRYYVTVQACNGVGLCTRKTSDGVVLDNSPPVPGVVHIGLGGKHQAFIGHRSTVSAQWIGFQDPHSDLDHFEWCLGTKPYSCDKLPFENVLLSNSVTKTGMNLTTDQQWFVTVKAYNRVGLSVNRTSYQFKVDDSPPEIVEEAKFITDGMVLSHRNGTQWENSLIRLAWQFQDNDSSIISHEIQLQNHNNGHSVLERVLTGSENKITIRLRNETLLRNGDTYIALVTACNAAGLCKSSKTAKLLIDSTPPVLGGFQNPMTWRNILSANESFTELQLTWYGFTDLESQIDKYYIAVSKNYSGHELSSGPKEVLANNLDINGKYNDTIRLSERIESGDTIIISIWASNNVGLRSSVGRATVTLIGTDITQNKGFLEIQRHSCSSHFCNDDCTCAVIGMRCEPENIEAPCFDISNETDTTNLNVSVFIGDINTFEVIQATTSSSCLSAFWIVDGEYLPDIIRFEWTIGLEGGQVGDLFDIREEYPWHDIGEDTSMTFCLSNGKQFIHTVGYIVYVRVWLSRSNFIVAESKPVYIDLTPANVRSHIKESVDGCQNDIDFLKKPEEIHICWGKVFSEAQGKILFYDVIGGTTAYGADLISPVTLKDNTSISINGSIMTPGSRYYFTVMATNHVGFVTTVISDGIMLDDTKPVAGVVFNTEKHKDVHYQSAIDTFGISLHGFDDHMSFVKFYVISLIDVQRNASIVKDKQIGIHNSIVLKNLSLQHNVGYKASAYAVDASGHRSDLSYSSVLHIDTTPPKGCDCLEFQEMSNLQTVHLSGNSVRRNRVSVNVYLEENIFYRLSLEFEAPDNSGETVLLSIGDDIRILHLAKNHNDTAETEYDFLSTINGYINCTVEAEKSLKFKVDKFKIYKCKTLGDSVSSSPIKLRQITPSIFSVCNMVLDEESGIKNIFVGAGTTRGGFQVLPLSSFSTKHHSTFKARLQHGSTVYVTSSVENHAGLMSVFHSNSVIVDYTPPVISDLNVKLTIRQRLENNSTTSSNYNENGTRINSTDSLYENNTESINTLPTTSYGEITMESNMRIHWEATDHESGVKSCYCAVGSKIGSDDIRKWQLTNTENSCSLTNIKAIHGAYLYPSVKCVNRVELLSIGTHGGVVQSFEPPSTSDANIQILLQNENNNPYHISKSKIQSNNSRIILHWDGVDDVSGIHHFEAKLAEHDVDKTTWIDTGLKNYHCFDVELEQGKEYTAIVKSLNYGNITSMPVNASVVIENMNEPSITGMPSILVIDRHTYLLDWSNVFHYDMVKSLVYEVTVGHQKGTADILKSTWTFETQQRFDFEDHAYSFYVTITAITPTGKFNIYRENVKLT